MASPEAQQRVAAATKVQRLAVELRPHDAAAYVELALAYQGHKFQRAASEALSVAVRLDPADAEAHRLHGVTLRATGDMPAAVRALEASLRLRPSHSATYFNLGNALADEQQRIDAFRHTLRHDPAHFGANQNLVGTLYKRGRDAEAVAVLRDWARAAPAVGLRKLAERLVLDNRKLEAAVHFQAAAANRTAPSPQAAAWTAWVDEAVAAAAQRAPKCLRRECIEGLEAALATAERGATCAAAPVPQSAEEAWRQTEGGAPPRPRLLRGALHGWRPFEAWDAAALAGEAGDDEVDVAVVERAGSFEVLPDAVLRPPKSRIRLRDLARLLALRSDANLTLYTRQAPLWPLPSLLADLKPLPWMERLRVRDLNFWLGDGHFRNTLHNDPFDNFLCQLRGAKHVQLWPAEAAPFLYYAPRRDLQATYEPGRGELGRHDSGIVSHNTAAVNGAAPDLQAFPRFAKAKALQSSCSVRDGAAFRHSSYPLPHSSYPLVHAMQVQPGDCLYLPRGVHHHVFSEADADAGFNLAVNIWVYRSDEDAPGEPVALGQLHDALGAAQAECDGGEQQRGDKVKEEL